MAIFNSYVKLPEGMLEKCDQIFLPTLRPSPPFLSHLGARGQCEGLTKLAVFGAGTARLGGEFSVGIFVDECGYVWKWAIPPTK